MMIVIKNHTENICTHAYATLSYQQAARIFTRYHQRDTPMLVARLLAMGRSMPDGRSAVEAASQSIIVAIYLWPLSVQEGSHFAVIRTIGLIHIKIAQIR